MKKKIEQLDRSLKEGTKLKEQITDNMARLARYRAKIGKLEKKIGVSEERSKELMQRCVELRERIALCKDGLADEISKL